MFRVFRPRLLIFTHCINSPVPITYFARAYFPYKHTAKLRMEKVSFVYLRYDVAIVELLKKKVHDTGLT